LAECIQSFYIYWSVDIVQWELEYLLTTTLEEDGVLVLFPGVSCRSTEVGHLKRVSRYLALGNGDSRYTSK
jgi:hypothetical protein